MKRCNNIDCKFPCDRKSGCTTTSLASYIYINGRETCIHFSPIQEYNEEVRRKNYIAKEYSYKIKD